MKFLQNALRSAVGLAAKRSMAIVFALFAVLIPQMAMAVEGDNIKLNFTSSDKIYLYVSLFLGFVALGAGYILAKGVLAHSPGSANMQRVGLAIKEGALAYLQQQLRMIAIFIVVLSIGLYFLYSAAGPGTAGLVVLCFVAGVAASYVAGYAGMLMAVNGNMRTAHAAMTSYKQSLEVAFRSGAVAGMVTVGMGLIGATLILLLAGDRATTLLVGFGFGGSLAALFMRVGGGIFTKAADVGADLVGKVEAGIPEDDPRNPATIADNVGDNVGDCAGMAADIFESYEVTLVAAIVLGAACSAIFDQPTWTRLILFALTARGVGIIASIIGIFSLKGDDDVNKDPLIAIRKGFWSSAIIAALGTGVLAWFMMGGAGNPIKTQKFNTVRNQTTQYQRDVVTWLSKAKSTKTPPELVTEFLATDIAKKYGVNEKEDKDNLTALFSNPPTLKSLGEAPKEAAYQVLETTSNNKALNYTIGMPPTEKSPKPTYKSVRDYIATKPKIFQIKITPPPTPDPKDPSKMVAGQAQTRWFGPVDETFFKEQIAKAKTAKMAVEELASKDIQFFVSDKDELGVGVVGNVDSPLRIQGVTLNAFEESPAEVEKLVEALQTAPQGAGKQPTQVLSEVGTIKETIVPWYTFALMILFGILMAFAIEILTDYYVSTGKKPTREVAGVASAGPAPMIIQGFAYAAESSVFMVFAIVAALIFPLFIFAPANYGGYLLSFYGIALVGLGLLTTTGYVLAMDTFGPISDNAQGVYEMSGDGHDNEYGQKAVQRLDAAGNTTKALTKGFAIATAVVAAVALFHSYLESARLQEVGLRLEIPEIFLGLMIGASAPFLFSAFAINAVGRAAFELINEVRRQFREDAGIMAGTSTPNYGRCVAIVTAAAQRELLGPGILAIAMPMAVAFGFSIGKPHTIINGQEYNLTGAQALGGFLVGAIVTGQLMAVLLANSGGMWDNAKKLIEDGMHGGKGTEAHKAAVVCDTVGDPFKDTAGPALNPLIKVMNLVALLLAAQVIRPLSDSVLTIITLTSVGALAFAIYLSKKGSLSSEMEKATSEPSAVAAAPIENGKKKLTVESLTKDEDHEA